jgi:hypothetical protein
MINNKFVLGNISWGNLYLPKFSTKTEKKQ